MKLYIPEIGDHLRLTSDWTFLLFNEGRNESLWKLYNCDAHPDMEKQVREKDDICTKLADLRKKFFYRKNGFLYNLPDDQKDPADLKLEQELDARYRELFYYRVPVKIPTGSLLAIDRIFIRKGMDEWSSLTFYLKEHPEHVFKRKPRFWAKLADCNNIEFSTF